MKPRISVVMGVYNGEAKIRPTIESILVQTLVDWELIIVDDGSADETPKILHEYAQIEPRIRIFRQTINGGLTRALIKGCAVAQGEFIARQDVGDISLETRLEKQLTFLEANPRVTAVGCGIRRVGPKGEFIGDATRVMSPEEITRTFLETGKAIVHAAAMFRRSAYEIVGGYRDQFRVAQDIDLWYRLCDVGLLAELTEVLAAIAIDIKGISASSNTAQHELAYIARACHAARRSGNAELELIEQAATISRSQSVTPKRGIVRKRQRDEASYFLGSELYTHRNSMCREYLLNSALSGHRTLTALMKYFLSFARCRKARESHRNREETL